MSTSREGGLSYCNISRGRSRNLQVVKVLEVVQEVEGVIVEHHHHIMPEAAAVEAAAPLRLLLLRPCLPHQYLPRMEQGLVVGPATMQHHP